MRGRKPKPTALKIAEGNPGKRRINVLEPKPPSSLPDCPDHLSETAREEWDRLAQSLNAIGLLTQVDRTTMAAYCQCYGRWVEAEQKLAETPAILRMPSGYIQQSPWLTISNKQLELMAKYMAELGLTPASRARLTTALNDFQGAFANDPDGLLARPTRIVIEPQFVRPEARADWEAELGPRDLVISAKDSSL